MNIHATDHKGNTGLMIAAAAGHLSVVNYLLKVGASQSLANHAGWTALHRACFNGRTDVVELLLDEADKERTLSPETAAGSEALLNAANHYGSTPLHVALPNGHLAVVKLLVERNPAAPLEARNASGDTPLHFAVVCRQPAIANFLLSQGANASAANDDGVAPLDTAVSTDQPTIVRTLAAIVMQQDVEKAATRKKRRLERTQYKMARSSASGAGSAASAGPHRPRTAKKSRSKGASTGSKAGSRSGSRNGSRGTAAKKADGGAKAASSASGKRKALVAQAWKAASLSTCVSLGLRDHELSTILTSLEMEVPGRIDRIAGAPPAPTVCAIRLAPSEATAVDLSNCSRALELQPDALVSVGVARKARKRLLGLIRGPEEATLYVEEHPDARSWSPYACRQLLDALQVPSTGNGTGGGGGGGVLEGASGLTLLAVRGAMARASSHSVRPDQAARHIPESLHSVLNVGAVGVPDSDSRDMIVHRRSDFDRTYDAVKEGVRSMVQLRAILKTAAEAESAETVLQAFKSSGEKFLTATDLRDGARQLGIELPLSGGELGEEVSTALVACVDSTGKGVISDEDFLSFVTGSRGQGVAENDAIEAMCKSLEAMEAAEAAVALIDALPSVLRHRLLFHCAVLNDLDSRGRAARQWWWMSGPSGTRGSTTITPPAAAPEEPEVQAQAQAQKDIPPADDGGWLSAAQAASGEGLRVQVVHFADLVTAFQEAANRSENHNLPSEVLRDARRAGGARGTVTSLTADGASGYIDPVTGSARVVLDDGADVLIPLHCLYVLPMVLVNPAQLRVGSCVRVVQPSWLKQLLLSAGHLAMGSVDGVSKDFGAQEVIVQSLNYPRLSNQRVLVRNGAGAEVDLPVEALLPSAESGASQVGMGKDPSAPSMGMSSSGGNLSGTRSSESTLLHTMGRGGGQQGGQGGIGGGDGGRGKAAATPGGSIAPTRTVNGGASGRPLYRQEQQGTGALPAVGPASGQSRGQSDSMPQQFWTDARVAQTANPASTTGYRKGMDMRAAQTLEERRIAEERFHLDKEPERERHWADDVARTLNGNGGGLTGNPFGNKKKTVSAGAGSGFGVGVSGGAVTGERVALGGGRWVEAAQHEQVGVQTFGFEEIVGDALPKQEEKRPTHDMRASSSQPFRVGSAGAADLLDRSRPTESDAPADSAGIDAVQGQRTRPRPGTARRRRPEAWGGRSVDMSGGNRPNTAGAGATGKSRPGTSSTRARPSSARTRARPGTGSGGRATGGGGRARESVLRDYPAAAAKPKPVSTRDPPFVARDVPSGGVHDAVVGLPTHPKDETVLERLAATTAKISDQELRERLMRMEDEMTEKENRRLQDLATTLTEKYPDESPLAAPVKSVPPRDLYREPLYDGGAAGRGTTRSADLAVGRVDDMEAEVTLRQAALRRGPLGDDGYSDGDEATGMYPDEVVRSRRPATALDQRLGSMDDEMDRREAELLETVGRTGVRRAERGDGLTPKQRAANLMAEETDHMIRQQLGKMDKEMNKKEREIRAAIDRQRRFLHTHNLKPEEDDAGISRAAVSMARKNMSAMAREANKMLAHAERKLKDLEEDRELLRGEKERGEYAIKDLQRQREEDAAELDALRARQVEMEREVGMQKELTSKLNNLGENNNSTSNAVEELQQQMAQLQLSKEGSEKVAKEIAAKLSQLSAMHSADQEKLAAYEGRVQVLTAETDTLSKAKEGSETRAQLLESQLSAISLAQQESAAQLAVAQMTMAAMNQTMADIRANALGGLQTVMTSVEESFANGTAVGE